MFAMLPPGGMLTLHRDPYVGSLRYHRWIRRMMTAARSSDGERYSWRDGEEVVFDATYLHWAENKTDKDRIILFCDIERPMKYRWAQAVNHAMGGFLMRVVASPNEAGDRTDGLNRAFKYLYQIHLVGKRLKAWNRTVYYIVKWLLVRRHRGGDLLALLSRYSTLRTLRPRATRPSASARPARRESAHPRYRPSPKGR